MRDSTTGISVNINQRPKSKHRPPPEAIDTHTNLAGLRAIASIECIKGIVVLAIGFGVLSLLHQDASDVVEDWIHRLHMSREGHLSRIFLRLADQVTDSKLWAVAAGALAYSTVRFVEAYGLWNARVWAEWFALLSGALYLPWEIFEIIARPSPLRYVIFATNLAVVLYMLYLRVRASRPVPD